MEEFESVEQAKTWSNSSEHADLNALGQKGSTTQRIVVPGLFESPA